MDQQQTLINQIAMKVLFFPLSFEILGIKIFTENQAILNLFHLIAMEKSMMLSVFLVFYLQKL